MADQDFEDEKIIKPRETNSGLREKVNIIIESQKEIHTALLGSILTGDGGLVRRMIETEMDVKKLAAQILEVEKWQIAQDEKEARKKESLKKWSRVGWVILAAAITTSITIFFNHLLKIK